MRLAGILTCLVLAAASPALAQTTPPVAAKPAPDNRIPFVVLDGRGVLARIGTDARTATELGVAELDLSPKSFGVTAGAHVYPWRGKSMALGIGGETIFAQSSFEPLDPKTNKPGGKVYNRRLSAMSAQLSLNFGHKAGWSYITAGFGPLVFATYPATVTNDALGEGTLNYGGGARWFNWDHVAITMDLRFYATNPTNATVNTVGRSRNTLFVMSAGFAIK